MSGPKPPKVELCDDEKQSLEKLVRCGKTRHMIVQRAQIVLTAAIGLNNEEIARQVRVHVETVRTWRGRWLAKQEISLEDLSAEDRLEDEPRSGAPARISGEQVCQIIALACELPKESGRPISQWTAREIAEEVMRRGIVDKISERHAARLLKRGIFNRTAGVTG